MAYTLVNPGDPIHASQLDQVINSLIGVAGAGQVLSFSALNDSTHYALTIQNQDGTNSNGLQVLAAGGTNILTARGTGVTVNALTVTGLTTFAAGVQIGPNTSDLLRPMPNDTNSLLLQAANYVNIAALGGNPPMLSSDAYYDGTTWQRGTSVSVTPCMLNLANGAFGWYTVPAGSGAMPAWTQRMGLDGSGNLTLQTGGLSVAGNSSFSQNLTVSAAVSGSQFTATNGNLYVGSAHIYDGGGGSTTLGGGLSVSGTATATGVTVNGTLTGNGATNVNALSCTTLTTNGQTITAGTINSGSINANGNVAATGNVTTLNNPSNTCTYTVGGSPEHIEHGHPSCNGVANGSHGTYAQTFSRAFNTNPIVLLTIDTPTSGDIENWHVAAQNVSTTGFNIRVSNSSGSGGNVTVDWYAIGN